MPGWVSSGWGLAGLFVAGGLLLLAVYDLTQRSRAVLHAFIAATDAN